MTYRENPCFQARAAEADEEVRKVLAALIMRWAAEDLATAGADVSLMPIHAAIAGAVGGVAELAWDSWHTYGTVESVSLAFSHQVKISLDAMQAERPPGKLFSQIDAK